MTINSFFGVCLPFTPSTPPHISNSLIVGSGVRGNQLHVPWGTDPAENALSGPVGRWGGMPAGF